MHASASDLMRVLPTAPHAEQKKYPVATSLLSLWVWCVSRPPILTGWSNRKYRDATPERAGATHGERSQSRHAFFADGA